MHEPAPPSRPVPTVLMAWTGTLLRALEAQGIDGRSLAAEAGIPAAALAEPDRRIPLAASKRLWRAAVDAAGDPALGIEVSRHVRPTTFHALGHAFLASPTLREALERTARYSHVTADHAVATVETGGGTVRLAVTWRPGTPPPAPEAVDAALASIVRSARFMLDRSVAPVEVELERPQPPVTDRFEGFFRCPIAYGARRSSLGFDLATAERPVAGGNARLARANDRVLVEYLSHVEADADVTSQARRAIADLLPSGEPSVPAVARGLDMSPRSLQRHLEGEGTSFRALLAEVRRDLAVAYLDEGQYSVTEVTYLLGFSETAAFSRAFRRWTGSSPSAFRRRSR